MAVSLNIASPTSASLHPRIDIVFRAALTGCCLGRTTRRLPHLLCRDKLARDLGRPLQQHHIIYGGVVRITGFLLQNTMVVAGKIELFLVVLPWPLCMRLGQTANVIEREGRRWYNEFRVFAKEALFQGVQMAEMKFLGPTMYFGNADVRNLQSCISFFDAGSRNILRHILLFGVPDKCLQNYHKMSKMPSV